MQNQNFIKMNLSTEEKSMLIEKPNTIAIWEYQIKLIKQDIRDCEMSVFSCLDLTEKRGVLAIEIYRLGLGKAFIIDFNNYVKHIQTINTLLL